MNNNGVSEDNVFNPYKLENNSDNSNNNDVVNALGNNIPVTSGLNINDNGNMINAVVTEVADGNSVAASGMTFNQSSTNNDTNNFVNNLDNNLVNNSFNSQVNNPVNSVDSGVNNNPYSNQNLPELPKSKVFIPTKMRNKMNEGQVYSNINNNNGNPSMNSNLVMNNGNYVNNDYASKKEKRNKIIALVGLGLVFVFIIVLIIKSIFFGASKELEMIFDPKQPIVVSENGLYGYVTHSGEKMLDVKYKYASSFYGKYAIVRDNNEDSKYSIIDKGGKAILSSEDKPVYVEEIDVWIVDSSIYSSKLKKVTEDNILIKSYLGSGMFSYTDGSKFGVMDYKGNVKYTKTGTSYSVDLSVNEFSDKELYMALETDNSTIIVHLNSGKEIKTFDKEYEALDNGIFYAYGDGYYSQKSFVYFRNGNLAYQIDGVSGLKVYDYKKQILEINYGYDSDIQYRYFNIKKNDFEVSLDSNSSRIDDSLDLQKEIYGYVPIKYESDKEGVLKGKKLVVPLEYDDILFPDSELYTYLKDEENKHFVLLKKGKEVILFNLKWRSKVEVFEDVSSAGFKASSTFMLINFNNGNTRIYNLITKKYLDENINNIIGLGPNYFVLRKDNSYVYYNTKMEKVFEGVQ